MPAKGKGKAPPLPLEDARLRGGIRRKLKRWFAKARRPLPWRDGYHPYRVWVSEMMLQQTQVDTVLPYYHRWMERFPDVESVAKAPEEAVLKAWEGLGYYRRARYLHKAARQIVERHQGQVPSALEDLLALPGIGRYTAGAIRSIGHDLPAPLVDGNVGRVLGRVVALGHPPASPEGQKQLWAAAEALTPSRHPRGFNEGLMELGALVCQPRNPDCPRCPLRGHCRAHALGDPEAYPPPNLRKPRPERRGVLLLLQDHGQRLLLRRRPPGGLWAGLWEPPWYEACGPEGGPKFAEELLRKSLTRLGIGAPRQHPPRFMATLRHGLTHMEWVLDSYAAHLPRSQESPAPENPAPEIDPALDQDAVEFRWADPAQRAELPMSRLARKALALIDV